MDAGGFDADSSMDGGLLDADSSVEAGVDATDVPDVVEASVESGTDASNDADSGPEASSACPPAIHSGSSAVAYQIDAQHTGAQPGDTLTLPLCQRWSHDFASDLSTPAIGNGSVFVVATPNGGPPNLYALDENTGAVVWGPKPLGTTLVNYFTGGVALDGDQLFAVGGGGLLAAFDPTTGTMA